MKIEIELNKVELSEDEQQHITERFLDSHRNQMLRYIQEELVRDVEDHYIEDVEFDFTSGEFSKYLANGNYAAIKPKHKALVLIQAIHKYLKGK